MYQNGHYGAALLAYAPVGFAVLVTGFRGLAVLGGVATAALAMLPDYDQRVPGIEHRGITHTVWFALLAGLALGAGAGAVGLYYGDTADAAALGAFGLLVGVLTVCSHVAADALTPAGVTPFWPLSDHHVSYGLVTADDRLANWLLLAAGALAAGGAYAAGLAL